MKKTIELEGKTVEEAIKAGLEQLGLTEADVTVEIIEKEKSGFLGIGSKPAKVKLTSLEEFEDVKEEVKEEKEEITEESTVDEASITLAKTFLTDIFSKMNVNVTVKCEGKGKDIKINLSGDEMGAVIGRRGETLDALQYLTTLAVNRTSEEYHKVSVDTENYRSEREKTLRNLALRLAEKAKKNRKNVAL